MSFCHLSPNSLSTVAPQHVAAPRLMMKIMMTGQEKQIKGLQLSVKKCTKNVVEIVAYMWAGEWLFANNWCDPSFLVMRANVTESVPITDVPPGTPTNPPALLNPLQRNLSPPTTLSCFLGVSKERKWLRIACSLLPYFGGSWPKRDYETLQTLGKWKIHRFKVHGLFFFIYIFNQETLRTVNLQYS